MSDDAEWRSSTLRSVGVQYHRQTPALTLRNDLLNEWWQGRHAQLGQHPDNGGPTPGQAERRGEGYPHLYEKRKPHLGEKLDIEAPYPCG